MSEGQTSSQDSTYQGLDLSKRDGNDEHYQSLNVNVDDTTYQGLDATQMNKEDDYQSLNANVDDTTYQELDATQMNNKDDGYETPKMKGMNETEAAYVIMY